MRTCTDIYPLPPSPAGAPEARHLCSNETIFNISSSSGAAYFAPLELANVFDRGFYKDAAPLALRKAGFSLVEVMVAILILGIAIVGLTHGITTALASTKESELQTTAAMYAAGLIENLRAEGSLIDGDSNGDCGTSLPIYQWKETIAAAGIDGLHQVDVTIQDSRSGQEIYSLRTLLFEIPPDTTSATAAAKDAAAKKKGARK
jgi:type IV pilus modification protein PilV